MVTLHLISKVFQNFFTFVDWEKTLVEHVDALCPRGMAFCISIFLVIAQYRSKWYQDFEYAAAHWLQKSTESVLFSVFTVLILI